MRERERTSSFSTSCLMVLTLQAFKSDQMNSFVNLSQQYGPGIANQAMAAVSPSHSSSHLPTWHTQFRAW